MRVHIGWAIALASLAATGGYTAAKSSKTPKGYIVAEVQVTDAEAYKAYVPGAGAAVMAAVRAAPAGWPRLT